MLFVDKHRQDVGEPFHREEFVLVDSGGNGLELERQASLAQQLDAPQTALIRSGNPGERLIRLLRPPVQGDLDRERRIFQQVVGDTFVDKDSVGKERNQESFFLGIGVDFEEVFAGKNLSARIK